MNCSPPGSSVHGILQAWIQEWVAMPSSRGSFQPRNRTQVSCIAGRFLTIWAIREALPQLHVHSFGHKDTHMCVALANLHNQGKQGWWLAQYLRRTKLQFSSVAQLCPTLCDPMDSCPLPTPGVYSNYVHRIGDAIQPSHPLSSHSPPAFNLCQHQGLFQWVSSSHRVARLLEFQLQH